MSKRRWTSFSFRKLSTSLKEENNISVSHQTVGRLLSLIKYNRKKNKKYFQVGKQHPLRNQQFKFINKKIKEFTESGDPIISGDCKSKIKIGNYSNSGTIYTPEGEPILTNDHDYANKGTIKVIPYGLYCVNDNTGFVVLATGHETPRSTCNAYLFWWNNEGKYKFNNSKKILFLLDGGGSTRSAGQLWKEQVYIFSLITGLEVHVCHYPPGCSKYNPVEHKLFSFISINWQGIPLTSIELIANLINETTTKASNGKDLIVTAVIDKNVYELKERVFTKEDFAEIQIIYDEEIPDLNYIIKPIPI